MNTKKIISAALALTLAFGAFTVLPEVTDVGFDTAITAYERCS